MSFSIFSNSSCNFFISSGSIYFFILIFDDASSIKSIALSGKNLSVIYLFERVTADFTASSVIFTLWCASYLSLIPFKISIVSASVGSSTWIGLNLLSNAESFSIYFLYSSTVVAPINWISPLASNGFKIFAASIAPSAAPAPTIVCISSINNIISPAFLTSPNAFFILSSKSPLYFVPATIPEISILIILFSFKFCGTSPIAIFSASPSTIAVFPTPGSPIKHGLFLVLLDNISIILSTSFSLPIILSNFPSSAFSVISSPNWFNVVVCWLFDLLFEISLFISLSISSSFITFATSL